MEIIAIEGMEFFSYHGCCAEEQAIGNKFIVDIEVETSLKEAETTDDISKTINYQILYLLVQTEMNKKSHLLEHVASNILSAVYKQFPIVKKVTVRLSKLNPPLGGKVEKASVILSR